jgi:hypothetical protein
MMVMENEPELDVRSECKAELRVDRTDISFHNLDENTVRVEVKIHNAGDGRSRPTPLRIESAPLGAFVPWQPLTRLLVPPLDPGESRVLSVDVARPRPIPLGDFDRVPPNRLLTAVSSPDEPVRPAARTFVDIFNLVRRGQSAPASGRETTGKGTLAPDLLDMMRRGHPHWAGNINVFIGTQAVERHRAKALRIYPGRTNMAMFIVGQRGRPDAYAFDLVGLAPDWKAVLYAVNDQSNFLVDSSNVPIEHKQWLESRGGMMVMLATHPPAGCETGSLEVHVTRRSCGKEAIVEFDLDPSAQGTGCYFV